MSKATNDTLFFYQGDKLITVKQGDQQRAIFRNGAQPLAELSTDESHTGGLLATDVQGSVLIVQDAGEQP